MDERKNKPPENDPCFWWFMILVAGGSALLWSLMGLGLWKAMELLGAL